MEKISLYIAGKKVDLDSNTFILFNYTMEDLSNPTIVKNSFSKQISLKGTPANNEIFGNLYRADRKTIFGEGYTGVAFDPLRKTPFTIYNEMNEIIESGYVKVDSVDKVSGGYEYKVTLYGGLGSFFYGLTYDEEGNKRTLDGLIWKFHEGYEGTLPEVKLTASMLSNKVWKCLEEGESYLIGKPWECWDIINFAPCYNGIPSDFDANKVLFKDSAYYPFSQARMQETTTEGVVYKPKEGCTSVLANLEKSHTEWEIRSLIAYLQRPVVRLKAIVDAIVIDGRKNGFFVDLASPFFQSKIYKDIWITLPLLKKEDRHASDVIPAILKSSLTPCEYLLSLAKVFGLVFIYKNDTKQVVINSRNEFYQRNTIDLSARIDHDSIKVIPSLTESKWYQLGGDKVVGEDAANYKSKYGKEYGSQLINTGYEFNSEISKLTKDVPFISAADVAERNYTNAEYWIEQTRGIRAHPLTRVEEIRTQLFVNGNGEEKEFIIYPRLITSILWSEEKQFVDWLPKVQFHKEDNKEESGEHCMIMYDGWKAAPSVSFGSTHLPTTYYLADDHPDIAVLNEGIPCWNLDTDLSIKLTSLPSFRRISEGYTLDWGIPLETYFGDSMTGVLSIYERYWKSLLSDQYDVDARLMTCKVNLSGMQVGQQLMRNFFFYENAIWVLNKISNHSITTEDLTECEFIKVKDIKNYTEGQKL
jgi:hypothetical protein